MKEEYVSKIDKKVLEYMEIYKTKKITDEKIKLGLKVKDELTKLTGLEIERVYAFDKYVWGKNDENKDTPSFCFLCDVRIRDIDKKFKIVEEYAHKNNISILFWTICQFDKRKNNPTELDYYIENYGVKIYDSEKIRDIDERVKVTTYAATRETYEWYYQYAGNNREWSLEDLLKLYALKIDYPVNDKQSEEKTIAYIKHISKDEYVLDKIEEFNKKGTDKLKICKELKEYIKNLKQIKPQMTVKDVPNMKIYEKLSDIKNKDGKVNISNLTKENLYTMEIIQGKMPDEIADLFEIGVEEIYKMRKKFGFKIIDSIWYNEIDKLIAKAVDQDMDEAYNMLKRTGIFNFEKYTYDILKYISDGERYLLKEFWKLVSGKREGLELMHATTAKDVYFRAYLCAEVLKQNGFISEVDFLTYKITKSGKKLLEELSYTNIKELNMIEIAKMTEQAYFYALTVIRLNNGEIMYCGDADELDKYCETTDKWENVELYTKEDDGNIIEVDFEDVAVKGKKSNKNRIQTKRSKADYNKINLSKEKVGKDSEKLIYDLEKERLKKENREDLAESVVWESEENGDGAGYDIRSYEKRDGEYVEIYIEVKGTSKSVNEPFDISINEIEASNKYKGQYYIYRVGEIYSDKPRFYRINGRIEDNFELEATSFKARKK